MSAESARTVRLLGCDTSHGRHAAAQGEFLMRRTITRLHEQLAEARAENAEKDRIIAELRSRHALNHEQGATTTDGGGW